MEETEIKIKIIKKIRKKDNVKDKRKGLLKSIK